MLCNFNLFNVNADDSAKMFLDIQSLAISIVNSMMTQKIKNCLYKYQNKYKNYFFNNISVLLSCVIDVELEDTFILTQLHINKLNEKISYITFNYC